MTCPPARADLVLPCLDEQDALPWVLDRVPDDVRAIVVDNGSTDRSVEIAEQHGATVVRCERRGYGAAVHAGLEAASADFVAFCDCDASIDPAAITPLLDLVSGGTADLAIGRRRPTTRQAWPLHARVGNRVLARRIRRRTGAQVHDLGSVRATRRQALLDLAVTDRRSGYPLELLLRAGAAGWRIAERDVDYHPRTGRSKVTGTMRGTLQAGLDMNRVWRRIEQQV